MLKHSKYMRGDDLDLAGCDSPHNVIDNERSSWSWDYDAKSASSVENDVV